MNVSEKQSKPLKDKKLRYIEYYDLQSEFDNLYERSMNNEIFDNLMDLILSSENILLAYRNVKSNTGSNTAGTDKLTIKSIAKMEQEEFVERVRKILFNYRPKAVRRKEILKQNGAIRPLGIPCIWDRIIQQCILQVMEPICEAKFSDNSYGFRPNRSCENAIAATYKHINRTGLTYIVEVNIKSFFDEVNHRKLLKQIYALNIRDKKLLYIIQQILKAPILLPNGKMVIPDGGTPQGGILSPLLANIVLNELDHWVESQWSNNPIVDKYSHRTYKTGTKDKSHGYRAMKTTKLKEMHIIRYADDFRIFCRSKCQAKRVEIAITKWLKDRLKLDVSPEKTRVVNLKRQHSEFLGITMKVEKKSGKNIIQSHVCEKALKKIKTESRKSVKEIQHASDNTTRKQAIVKYNTQIMGWHNYYEMATMVASDFGRIGFTFKKYTRNRLNQSLKKQTDQTSQAAIVKKYGKSRQARYVGGLLLVPLAYVKTKPPMNKKKEINKYTVEGRKAIHKNMQFDTSLMLQMMKQRQYGRSIEYMDNRISLLSAQCGKCAITGRKFEDVLDIHCHHIVPRKNGGKDNYENLTLMTRDAHVLVHATNGNTINSYISKLKLSDLMKQKVNKLRTLAGNEII
ncbi:group II intron reverse transcriptase/maturase [uncultured Trichococcus sp.]|uniref:group II intron reverse transcriptase/maturase n=1 Tax=uncultured Trichococcus sp. TaxID=189665 RepID=UPI0037499FCA